VRYTGKKFPFLPIYKRGGAVLSEELKALIVQVLTSWQVLAVTIGIIIYIFIVTSVAKLYRSARPKKPKTNKPQKEKKEKKEKKSDKVTEDTEDLGLGE
jgi:type VI protein secretion system component VasK